MSSATREDVEADDHPDGKERGDVRAAQVGPEGAGIFLSAADLRTIGVDPSERTTVDYRVVEGGVEIEARDTQD